MFGFKLIFCWGRTKTNVMTPHFIRRDHATIVLIIVLLIFENVIYLKKKCFIICYFSFETFLFI